MDISFIIPVFNAEKYLNRCLDSIIKSCDFVKEKKIEILLVNNNSMDGSVEIIKEYVKKYPKITKLLNCNTPGASAARNYGFKKATGEFIWFIDADDSIDEKALKLITDKIEKTKPDILMVGAERIYKNRQHDYLSAVDESKDNYKSRFVRYGAGPWQFVFKRTWWKKNDFKFHEGIIHEDMELMSALILYTDSFTSIDKPLYKYYENPDSVLHKKSWDPHYLDIFLALEGLYSKFDKKSSVKDYYGELEWFFIWNLLIDSAKDFSNFKEGKVGFDLSRKMLKKYFPNWRKNKFLREKPLKFQIVVRINYYKK